MAGLEERDRRVVVNLLRLERFHKTQLIDHFCRPRHQVADPCPAFTMFGEFENGTCQRERRLVPRHPSEPLAHADAGRKILAVHLIEQWLVIKQIELRRAAAHEQINDPICLGHHMRRGKNAFERVDVG